MTKRATAAQMVANVDAMIAETAYYKAEQRGFDPGHEVADWLAAEREVEAILSASAPLPAKRPRAATTPRAKTKTPRKTRSRKVVSPEGE